MSSLDIPEHYIRTYEKNWNHRAQQEMSKLRDRVMVKEFEGKECILTDLDQATFSENKGRLGRSNPKEVTGRKRKLTKRLFDTQFIFDKDDDTFLGMLGEPTSELIEETTFAWRRKIDELILEASTGTVRGGVEQLEPLSGGSAIVGRGPSDPPLDGLVRGQ